MKFRELLTQNELHENVQGITENTVGYIIVKTMALIAQAHVWHLVIRSGQKHTALNELYTTLQDEVDELAERYIGQGGVLPSQNFNIDTGISNEYVLAYIESYRFEVSACISELAGNAELSSILDGVIDLQECIDSFAYKFKLD